MHKDRKLNKQTRITVALDAYPDVKKAVRCYFRKFKHHGPTDLVIPALRDWLIARKKDLAQ